MNQLLNIMCSVFTEFRIGQSGQHWLRTGAICEEDSHVIGRWGVRNNWR